MEKKAYSSPAADVVKFETENIMFISIDNDVLWNELWTGI